MTELKVDTVVNLAGTGKPNFENGVTINGAATSTLNLNEYTESASEPTSPSNGALWWDTANEKTFIYAEGEWKETIAVSSATWYGSRGLFFGGDTGSFSSINTIDYVDITSASNASDFGDMTGTGLYTASMSNGTRAVSTRGFTGAGGSNVLMYVATATTGNATDFGDISTGTTYNGGACSDGSRGIRWAGESGTVIDYITIDTTGNATDFGDEVASINAGRCVGSATYGFRGAGNLSGTLRNDISYITIQTTGNAADWGDLTRTSQSGAMTGDTTRGLYCGGNGSNVIDYFGLSSAGNASDFGDLSSSRFAQAATSDGTTAIIAGGYTSGGLTQHTNTIDKVTIQTTGNATDHGDLTVSRYAASGTSGSAS
jgi:hypothetical protein